MLTSVFKDCGDVLSRLFDHRPFTNGEINFFVTEFESQRKEREVEKLRDAEHCVIGIKKCTLTEPNAVLSSLTKLSALADVATQNCQTILDNQALFDSSEALKENRERRAADWETFNRQIELKMTEVDFNFVEKEKELIDLYKDLDRKLHLSH